jgi:hypothetical protein
VETAERLERVKPYVPSGRESGEPHSLFPFVLWLALLLGRHLVLNFDDLEDGTILVIPQAVGAFTRKGTFRSVDPFTLGATMLFGQRGAARTLLFRYLVLSAHFTCRLLPRRLLFLR